MAGKEKFSYVIAFSGDLFVMVRNKARAWEMPGGRLQKGENYEQAAVREFFEETGMTVEILGQVPEKRSFGRVFVGLVRTRLLPKAPDVMISEVGEFAELPDELSFPEVEYRRMLDRARVIIQTFKMKKGIGAPASPLTSKGS